MMTSLDAFSLVALTALVVKFTSFLKFLTNRDWNSTINQAEVWVGGVIVVWLAANSDIARYIVISGETLGKMNMASLVLAGLAMGSAGSVLLHDYPNALDNHSTVAEPPLIPGLAKPTHLPTTLILSTDEAPVQPGFSGTRLTESDFGPAIGVVTEDELAHGTTKRRRQR